MYIVFTINNLLIGSLIIVSTYVRAYVGAKLLKFANDKFIDIFD